LRPQVPTNVGATPESIVVPVTTVPVVVGTGDVGKLHHAKSKLPANNKDIVNTVFFMIIYKGINNPHYILIYPKNTI
jgi:hypothetical protein